MRRRICVFHNSNRQKDVNVDRGLHICPTRTRSQKDLNMALNVHSNVALCVWKSWNAKTNCQNARFPICQFLDLDATRKWYGGGMAVLQRTTHCFLTPSSHPMCVTGHTTAEIA